MVVVRDVYEQQRNQHHVQDLIRHEDEHLCSHDSVQDQYSLSNQSFHQSTVMSQHMVSHLNSYSWYSLYVDI